jgi:hypothetical protein
MLHVCGMKQLLQVLLMVVWAMSLSGAEDLVALRLSRQEVKFLDEFLELKPGMTEGELRERLPELGSSYMNKSTHHVTVETSRFRLAGMEWGGYITLVEGRVQKAVLHASAWKEAHPKIREQVMPQYEVRAIGLLIAAHYANKFGKVSEGYVPNTDCPAGNPFGLRQRWHVKDAALVVEFNKNSSTSSLEILLAEWTAWEKEEREFYGTENSWPLKPAPKALLLEVSKR